MSAVSAPKKHGRRERKPSVADEIGPTWTLKSWPPHVYPHEFGKARWLVRGHRDDLIAAGVLTRVGREIIVIGRKYQKWLESRAVNVADYPAPGRDRTLE